MKTSSKSWRLLFLVSLGTLALDAATKAWAVALVSRTTVRYDVWQDHLYLVLMKNRLGPWGLSLIAGEVQRSWILGLGSIAGAAFIVITYSRFSPERRAFSWALSLALGGILGNELDRFRHGYVIDFLDFHTTWGGRDRSLSICNIADIALRLAVFLAGWDLWRYVRRSPAVVR
jgi:signal peptidase II